MTGFGFGTHACLNRGNPRVPRSNHVFASRGCDLASNFRVSFLPTPIIPLSSTHPIRPRPRVCSLCVKNLVSQSVVMNVANINADQGHPHAFLVLHWHVQLARRYIAHRHNLTCKLIRHPLIKHILTAIRAVLRTPLPSIKEEPVRPANGPGELSFPTPYVLLSMIL